MISYLHLRGLLQMNDADSRHAPPPQKIKTVKSTVRSSARWVTQYNGH